MKKIVNFLALTVLLSTIILFTATSFAQAQTEISLTAIASGSYGRNTPDRAVDGNLSTYWNGPFSWSGRTCWLRLDSGDTYSLSSISIWWHNRYGATNYDIQISSDGSSWTSLYTGLSSTGGATNPHLVTYDLSGNARYVRIYIKRAQRYYPRIYEVKIYGQPPNQPPTADAQADPTSGEAPLEVQFTGGGQDPDGSIASYSWDFGDGQSSNQQNPTHTYQNPGTYTTALTVTDDDSATDDDDVTITVTEPMNQLPAAQAGADPTFGEAPLEVQFTGIGQDPDGTIASYHWGFGDGQTSDEQNPTHIYENLGTYVATLTVTDNDGATGTDSVIISVMPEAPEGIPHLIRFQGRLTDKDNKPLTGTYDITFGIYDTEEGGVPEWSETHTNVQITNGILNVLLGSINPIDLPFDEHYWLSTEIGNDGEMQPRQRITSVGYTYRTEFAQKGGTVAYTTQGEITKTLSSSLSIHLEAVPTSVKLYIWGEPTAEQHYPDGLSVKIDGVDKTSTLLALANANWGTNETKLGDGTGSHPLVFGAGGATGTGVLDITALIPWSPGEHTVEFSHSVATKAKVRCNAYINY